MVPKVRGRMGRWKSGLASPSGSQTQQPHLVVGQSSDPQGGLSLRRFLPSRHMEMMLEHPEHGMEYIPRVALPESLLQRASVSGLG